MFKFPGLPIGPLAGTDTIGIDVSGTTLKIVHMKASPANKREICNIASISIAGLADADIAKHILNALSAFKVKKFQIIDVIPSHAVITKNIEVPSTNPSEIKEIINLQAGRHTPYSREEVIVDYVDIGVYKKNYTKILLIIIARNVIKRHFEILQKASLRLDKVLFAPEGLMRFVVKQMKIENLEAPVGIVHLDDHTSDFTVSYKNKLLYVRSVPIGVNHLENEKEKYAGKFNEELKKSIESYQGENIEKPVGTVVVTGSLPEAHTLESDLNQLLHLPVKVFPYLKSVPFRKEIFNQISSVKGASFLNTLAALAYKDEAKIDLVPEEIRLKNLLAQRAKDLIRTAVLAFTVIVLIFSALVSKIYFKNAYLKKLTADFGEISKNAAALEDELTKINIIKSFIVNRGYSLEVLADLHSFVPLEMQLDEVRFDEQGKFTLKGTADSMSLVFSFVDNMEKSKFFKDVKTKYTTKRKEGKKDLADFEITCLLEKEAGE